jgi:hypothetical protein
MSEQKTLSIYVDMDGTKATIPRPSGHSIPLCRDHTWDDVETYLTDRGIGAEMDGPYYSGECGTPRQTVRVSVYVRFLDTDEEALWASDLEHRYGWKASRILRNAFSTRDCEDSKSTLLKLFQGLPGAHRTVRAVKVARNRDESESDWS